MSSILDLPEVRDRVSPITVKDYHRLSEFNEHGKRTELIRGIVIAKMSKSSLHSWLASRLFRIMTAQLPVGFFVRKEDPLTLADSEPEPDLAVIAGEEDGFISGHPRTAELVVEIAVTNPSLDRANAEIYAEAGVPEYWIVLGREQRVEVYRGLADGRYGEKVVYSRDQRIDCVALPGVGLDLWGLFAVPA